MNDLLADDDRLIPKRDIYTVSRLNSEVRALLEGGFPLLWLEGEISNLARPSSGHWYFSLKDSKAQVRCAMFRNRNQLLRFKPIDGNHVLVRARVSLYEGRGEFQLLIEHMEEAGDGALLRAFEELKQRLAREGLFDEAHKKPLPGLPACIGIVTSPTGAAIRDIVSVLQRRFPAIRIIIYPVAVQGSGASAEIARAIRIADERQECDVLIVGRGGGSLEDLWAFNEEIVARAIHECSLPVVSAVGHEIDFTIADFVADVRAPTPSAAAEYISPDQDDWLQGVMQKLALLRRSLQHRLQHYDQRLAYLDKRLQHQHPGVRVKQQAQKIDELEMRLRRAQQHHWESLLSRVSHLAVKLNQHTPAHRLQQYSEKRANLTQRLHQRMMVIMQHKQQQLTSAGRTLHMASPLATLERGYSILLTGENRAVRDAAEVQEGDTLQARLARGSLQLRVEQRTATDSKTVTRTKK